MTRRKTIYFTYALLILSVSFSFSQAKETTLMVLASEGALIGKDTLRQYDIVADDDVVQLSSKGFVSFVYNNGKVLEYSGEQVISIKNTIEQAAQLNGSVTSISLIDSLKNHTTFDDRSFHETRNIRTSKINFHVPDIEMGRKLKVYDRNLFVSWCISCENVREEKDFVITYYSLYAEPIFDEKVAVNNHSLNLDSLNYQNKQLMIKVYAKDNPAGVSDNIILLMTPQEEEKIKGELSKLHLDNSAASDITRAFYFEANELFYDVVKSYHSAMSKRPEVDDYKKLYMDYLHRNNILDL